MTYRSGTQRNKLPARQSQCARCHMPPRPVICPCYAYAHADGNAYHEREGADDPISASPKPSTLLIIFIQKMPMVGLELCAVFVERDSMAEGANGSIAGGGRNGRECGTNLTEQRVHRARVDGLVMKLKPRDLAEKEPSPSGRLEHILLEPAASQ